MNSISYYQAKSTHVFFLNLIVNGHNLSIAVFILALHDAHRGSILTHITTTTMNSSSSTTQNTP